MCGIIGYHGVRPDAPRLVFDGLKKLEYRGYDSWGIAAAGSQLAVMKRVGKLPKNLPRKYKSRSSLAIGHTRWATHGGVTEENAHPHLSCDKKIAVVHNGIIENWARLKNELISKGHRFRSETDTEIISHLVEEHAKNKKFEDAVLAALDRIEGSYAIIVISADTNKMVAARKDSPLVLGIGANEHFAASDIPAFLDFTKRVMYLADNDVAVIDGGVRVYNTKLQREVRRVVDEIEWDVEQAKKGDYEHFMLKEICEQAETLKRAANQDIALVNKIAKMIKSAHGTFFVACGSSYHACKSAEFFFSKIAKAHVNVVLASEFKNYAYFLKPKSLVIAVSQSGETADVLEAVKIAKQKGAKILSVCNVQGSSLTRHSDDSLLMHAGPEICVLSTKTYTSQVALLLLLAYAAAGRLEDGKKVLSRAWNLAFHLTAKSTREHIGKLAKLLYELDAQHIFTIGRDLQYPTALEAALKIKEVSYIHAEGFAGGELKHGTIALIEKNTPCIVFVAKDIESDILSNAQEIKARGGFIIGVSPVKHDVFDFWIRVPESGLANPIAQIIPIQVLAYQLAVLRGLDPDRPRNLAKSVTVK